MARCTAPVRGHRTSSGAANCPACGSRSRSYFPSYPRSSDSFGGISSGGISSGGVRASSSGGNSSGGSRARGGARPSWVRAGSSVSYTHNEAVSLAPVREVIERRAAQSPDLRDVFLCHAWADRKQAAEALHGLLTTAGVKVWFSEKDLALGTTMMRSIDKGLANSRIGLVLVTPALLERIRNEGVAEKELSVLLERNLLIPVVHNTTYEALRDVSPLLASRSGLSTKDDTMEVVAEKIAELVQVTLNPSST